MSQTITFYFVSDDDVVQQARDQIKKLTGVDLVEVICPPTMREFYRIPFIRDETGSRHFGLEGIDRFVSERTQLV